MLTIINGFEVLWNGESVWVNASDGMCVGRFTQRGVDVHHDVAAQLATGKECLACSHEPDWSYFCAALRKYYKIELPAEVQPT